MTAAYLDCNATTPLDPAVRETVVRHLDEDFGNAGSRTHERGNRAKQAAQRARTAVARLVGAREEEVLFTSGATESDNLAILGLAAHGESTGRRHLVTSAIEHKAVLEPLQHLAGRGFDLTVVPPTGGGWVDPAAIAAAIRPDTLLVSVMQVNNETGIIQPIADICQVLNAHETFLHIDAAQGFGKDPGPLTKPRIDLISLSGHKLYAPQGVGALIARRRGYNRPPLAPLAFGGGQERGLRPGTLAVPLIAGLGVAADLARQHHQDWAAACRRFREGVLAALLPLGAEINGEAGRSVPHTVNLSFPGLDSEAVMLAWKGIIACSNGSACTSSSYQPSHVLTAMGLSAERIRSALRLSWCYQTGPVDWDAATTAVRALQG